jgi:hypothetical protein
MLRLGMTSPLPVLLDSLYEEVIGHCRSQLLADDCTMLAVRRPLRHVEAQRAEPQARPTLASSP